MATMVSRAHTHTRWGGCGGQRDDDDDNTHTYSSPAGQDPYIFEAKMTSKSRILSAGLLEVHTEFMVLASFWFQK